MDPASAPRALLLSGSLGMGHDVMAQACAGSLARRGWHTDTRDAMALLGSAGGRAGEQVFRRLLAVPALYDGFHFAHLRPGTRLALTAERAATRQLVPRLRSVLRAQPARLVVSVFSTAAAAAAALKREDPARVTVTFCTDAAAHRLWVHEGTDLYLVTSQVAACSVRRYLPRARVEVVPAPVRPGFYDPPTQVAARHSLGVPPDARCVLVMSGAWGIGPVAAAAATLARAGVWVLAVSGHNARLLTALRAEARSSPRLVAFGFTDQIPMLMAASDVVLTASGDTCAEARVIGRHLLLLDVVPGHGRDNLQHELELGDADVTGLSPPAVAASTFACLDHAVTPTQRVVGSPAGWEAAFSTVLDTLGLA